MQAEPVSTTPRDDAAILSPSFRRTDRSEKGYYVETAWPTNED
jgi:hypothetical protein